MAIDKNYSQKLYCSTAKMTEEEWENERRKALGGSDMAVVLGMSPFEGTRLSVYNEKTGKKPVEPMEDKTRVIFDSGHFLENMVANLFDYRSGYETYEVKAMFEHLHHPYLRGNIDRFYRRHGEKAPLGFLECKTTSEFNSGWGNDNIPMHYKIQLSTYLSILNMDMCQIACLKLPESLRWVAGVLYQMKRVFGKLPANVLGDIRDQLNAVASSEIKPYVPMVLSAMGGAFLIPERLRAECSDAISTAFFMRSYERDEILEEYILEEAEKFWHNHVEKHISPSLENETGANAMSTLRKYTPRFHASTPVMMPHEAQLADCYRQMTELNERKSALSKRTKEITEQIQKLSVPFVTALNGADRGTFSYDGNSYEVVYSGGERVSIPKKNTPCFRTLIRTRITRWWRQPLPIRRSRLRNCKEESS